jgi:hypothetical protein
MSWFTTFKDWLLSWFTDANKQKLLALLTGIKGFVDAALPIVKEIDELLKPMLEKNSTALALYEFLLKHISNVDYVSDLAKKLSDLPLADMLANVALEILRTKVPATASLSVLRLAIELAYNLYKTSK